MSLNVTNQKQHKKNRNGISAVEEYMELVTVFCFNRLDLSLQLLLTGVKHIYPEQLE